MYYARDYLGPMLGSRHVFPGVSGAHTRAAAAWHSSLWPHVCM